jgi:DNA invertase Pin-like site-specific DNA recombinase
MRKRTENEKAVAYLRTSSAANIGADKDSDKRQREAIQRYAKGAGFELVAEYYDAAVSGADPIEARSGFSTMLDAIEGNGVRVVIVEDASRFARDLVIQELGILSLIRRGVRVLTAGGDDLTESEDPTRKLMRQVAGAFAEYERARLVAKLRHARDRKSDALRKAGGPRKRIEGRKPAHVLYPEATAEAKRLRRASPKSGERRSFRAISTMLAKGGHVTKAGKPFTATAVKRMVEGPAPERAGE